MRDICARLGRDNGAKGGQQGSKGAHVPFQVAVHDGEKDLQEQVDGIHQYRKEV